MAKPGFDFSQQKDLDQVHEDQDQDQEDHQMCNRGSSTVESSF